MRLQDIFVPMPHKVTHGETAAAPGLLHVLAQDSRLPASARALLADELPAEDAPVDTAACEVVLDPARGAEAYRLRLEPDRVRLHAGGEAGLFYGVATLVQWLRAHRRAGLPLRTLEVSDRPDFAERGVMLDISRNKVPTLDTLYRLVDLFAGLKLNQLQLYTEHTFAYRGHEAVWRDFSPLTGQDIEALDAYCADRFVMLVPNQNSFGHFHRWLVHDAYRPLAECPEGIEHPFSTEREPFSLCATDDRVPALLADLYDQLLPHFRAPLCNVGLDETFDLGDGRSAEACARRGKTVVYLDFLRTVHRLVRARGRRMMFWGDIIIAHPEHLAALPEDAVALAWGYGAEHPFDSEAAALAASGRTFYVCPGTSSWNSFAGLLGNCRDNLRNAAENGLRHGARGYLITDWGDRGHLQPLSVSYPGFLMGADLAWHAHADWDDARLDAALDAHVWGAPHGAVNRCLRRLGDLYRCFGDQPENGSPLFFLWFFPEEDLLFRRVAHVTEAALMQAAGVVAECLAELSAARAQGEAETARIELFWVARMLQWCISLGQARLAAGRQAPLSAVPAPTREALAVALEALWEERQVLWQWRNRKGGLHMTAKDMHRVAAALRAHPPATATP